MRLASEKRSEIVQEKILSRETHQFKLEDTLSKHAQLQKQDEYRRSEIAQKREEDTSRVEVLEQLKKQIILKRRHRNTLEASSRVSNEKELAVPGPGSYLGPEDVQQQPAGGKICHSSNRIVQG